MKLRMILPVIAGSVLLSLVALGVVLLGHSATPARAQGGQVCILIFPPPPGCEQPAEPLTVTSDRTEYAPGATIAASVTNNTGEIAYGGGGYACGVVGLEVWNGSEWSKAPGGAEVCTAIALGVRPGETRMESFAAPATVGWYRLIANLTGDAGNRLTAYSTYFLVY